MRRNRECIMEKDLLNKIIALRKKLHEIPERSLAETKTKQTLMQFLQENTTLSIVDCGKWFYAVRKADVGDRKAPVAFPGGYGRGVRERRTAGTLLRT